MNLTLIFLLIVFLLTFFIIFKSLDYKKEIKKLKIMEKNNKQKLNKQENKIKDLETSIKVKLKKARKIHQRMLPDRLSEPDGYFISDYYQPAEYIGGDYYNIFKIDHESLDPFFDQYLLYFFDVSGHGIDSTLLSIFINESIENYFKLRHNPGEKISTSELINYIDLSYQKENFPDDYLVCLFISVLDVKKETLSYSSGGFQFPIFKFGENEVIEEINIGGLPISTALGYLDDARPEKIINFKKNNTLMLSTDGLFEQTIDSKMYFNRLKSLLKDYQFLPVPFLKDLICHDFYQFTNDNRAEDDITFLLVERSEAEIISFNLNQENLDQIKFEIKKFLKKNIYTNNININKAEEIIAKFLENSDSKLKIKATSNNNFVFFSFEKESDFSNFNSILKNNYFLSPIVENEKTNEQLISNKIIFNKEKIYYSLNSSKNKIYLMLLKE